MPSLTIKAADGGMLITRASAEDAGIAHLTKKTNVRRDLSDEILREGWDYFDPLPDHVANPDYQQFPFPDGSGAPLTLVHLVRRPNGENTVVVGTKETLYRFNLALAGYFEDGYIAPGYFTIPTRWQIIGQNFSANGRRWEAKDIDGTTIFNNGDDLPVAFRVEWSQVKPIYELREQGIVCLGTIGETNGVLLGGDVTELRDQERDEVLNVISSGAVNIAQAGYKASGAISATSDGTLVTASGAIFALSDVGRTLQWWNGKQQVISGFVSPTQVNVAAGDAVALGLTFRVTDKIGDSSTEAFKLVADAPFFTAEMAGRKMAWADGTVRKIATVANSQLATTDIDIPVASGVVWVENPITYLSKSGLVAHWAAKTPPLSLAFDNRQYRILWSESDQPTRFAVSHPATFELDSVLLRVDRMNRSLESFESVTVVGAGISGGVLNAEISAVGPGVIRLTQAAAIGGTGTVQRTSAVGSIVGHYDVQDDGAAILKMAVLQSRLVVYTDSNIFLGAYTADPASPFLFERVKVEHGRALHFRNTLVAMGNSAHVYAGRTQFYQFDLTSRQPTPIQAADLVSNLFFDYASIADTESIFAADNKVTQEVWVVCPANAAHPILAYDYVYQTFSTIDAPISCAAAVKKPVQLLTGATGDWFLLGTSAGTLLVYGLATEANAAWENAKAIYYRRSARPYGVTKNTYTGVLASGRTNLGDFYNEKHLSAWALAFSSLQDVSPTVSVSFYTSLNQSGSETLLGTALISDADLHGLVPIHSTAHLFRDEITIQATYPVRLHSRTFEFQLIRSKSHHRA